ncbi:MAG: TatD family hydrolase [Patescibacteria group bacterium]
MIDIHTHLFWDSYDADRDRVIARAREAGVEQMICVGTSPEDNPQAIAVAEKYDGIYASVGIHPSFFNEIEKEFQISNFKFQNKFKNLKSKIENHPKKDEKMNEVIATLRRTAQSSKKVIAIGECGLDYFSRNEQGAINDEQKKIQKKWFLAQIALAQELGLPLIIHTRPSAGGMPSAAGKDAYEDMYEILKDHSSLITHPASHFVLHCYQGDTEITEKFLTLPNVYFSFAGNITYPVKKTLSGTKPARIAPRSGAGGDDLSETVMRVPLGRLFTETDCPFLSPQRHRGERNEPAFVVEAVDKVALLHEVTRKVVEEATMENASRIFFD